LNFGKFTKGGKVTKMEIKDKLPKLKTSASPFNVDTSIPKTEKEGNKTIRKLIARFALSILDLLDWFLNLLKSEAGPTILVAIFMGFGVVFLSFYGPPPGTERRQENQSQEQFYQKCFETQTLKEKD